MTWAVNVPRVELLAIVTTNRDGHKAIVDEALEGYRTAVINELSNRIETIKSGKPIDVYIRLPQPESHLGDYDTIIGMLSMSTEETVSLGPNEYRSYVQDQWSWTGKFAADTSGYTVSRQDVT